MAQTRFTLGTFDNGTGTFPGLVVDETVDDARQVVPHPTVAALLTDWATSLPALTAAAAAPVGDGVPLSGLRVLPPVTPPGQLFAAGANYRQHVIQMAVAHKLGAAALTPGSWPRRRRARSTSVRNTVSRMSGPGWRRRSAAPTTT